MKAELVGNLRSILRLVWSEASPFVKRRLLSVLILVITASILTAFGPIALKLVVDGFTGQTKGSPASPLFLIGLFVLSQFLARAVGEVRGLVYARAERRMFRTLSERLFAHLLRLPLRFHLDRQTGAINQVLVNGLQGYQMVVHHLVFTFLPVTAELGTMILVLRRLAPPALLSLFCGALVSYGVAFGYAATRIAKSARQASASNVEANAAVTDSILNCETIKYFAAESIVQGKVSRALIHTETEWAGFYRRYAINGLCVAMIFAVFLGSTTVYAAGAVHAGRMTVGDFVLINTYLLQVVRPVESLGYAMQGLSQGVAMLEKMLELFRERPEPQDSEDHAPMSGPVALEFEDVWLSYRPGHSVLKGLSFKIPAGKTLGIVGPSGSGKSTTVRLLVRLFETHRGRILLGGVSIDELPLSMLRRSIAVVPQDTVLFNETIGDNIAFGKPDCTHAEVEQAARLANLHDFIMSLPDRYDTRVGERGVKLSGGERQRVSIARAAIKQPLIYVFDEATSSLDSKTERAILSNLREISKFSTTLVIAHRLSTVVHADEIIVLDAGGVVERGTHASLMRGDGVYAGLWQAQRSGSAAIA